VGFGDPGAAGGGRAERYRRPVWSQSGDKFALAVGPTLHQLCRNVDPTMVIGIAVLAYCMVIGLLWLGFSLLNDTAWLVGKFAGAGVLVVTVAWAVGHMRAAIKLRQPLYQQEEPTAER
jgi:hypothetical protein